MPYSAVRMTSKAEAAVTGRDWKQVEAELDRLVPGGPERDRPASSLRQSSASDGENALLSHIADALRLNPSLSEDFGIGADV